MDIDETGNGGLHQQQEEVECGSNPPSYVTRASLAACDMSVEHRYFLRLAYDGTNYIGWQVQFGNSSDGKEGLLLRGDSGHGLPSVQYTLSKIVTRMFKCYVGERDSKNPSSGERPQVMIMAQGCGRTDAGVHASDFYAHFDVDEAIPKLEQTRVRDNLIYRLNQQLPDDIVVKDLFRVRVKPAVHSRRFAIKRSYEYRIVCGKHVFQRNRAFNWTGQQHIKLDMKALEEACAVLRTSTDFKPFAKGGGKVHDYICHVSDAYWTEATVDTGDVRGPLRTLTFHISSNRFLRNMVRCIVGTLLRIGQGKMSVLELQRVCNGAQGAVQVSHNKVPACGLYLCGVLYPQNIRASSSPAH